MIPPTKPFDELSLDEHKSMIKIAMARLRACDVIEWLGPSLGVDAIVTTLCAAIAIHVRLLPAEQRDEALSTIDRTVRGITEMLLQEQRDVGVST